MEKKLFSSEIRTELFTLLTMTEPSLLCVNCASPPPPHRRTWGRCTVCIARNLPSTYYCGEECMNAHWPKHKEYHKAQQERAKERREGTVLERDRSSAEAQARLAEMTGNEYEKRGAAALAFGAKGDYNAAAKAYRKIIKEWPDRPEAYHNLASAMNRSNRLKESAQMYLKALELQEEGTKDWADSVAAAFTVLKTADCREVPKPEWWNDEALKALSARVVALVSDKTQPCLMRAFVLCGTGVGLALWSAGPRTAAEIKEASTWYRRAAETTGMPSTKLGYEQLAQACAEFADPLLAKEEAEAAKARAAAETEAAKARAMAEAEAAEVRKVAEAKATAAADELLAEEEKEKEQASTKAGKTKQGKGKKGKGKQR